MLRRLVVLPALCLLAMATASAQPPAQRPGGPPEAQQRPGAQTPTQMPAQPRDEPGGAPAGRFEVATAKEEKISQTSHALRLDGRDIKCTGNRRDASHPPG